MSHELDDAGSRTAGGGRVPLFCGCDLAGRIERAEARLMAEVSEAARRRRADGGGFVVPVAGGVATFAEQGSPYNKIAGLGFGGLPDPAALAEIERAFAGRGAGVQVEVASLADPALVDLLTGRGYRLAAFENVLGRDLSTGSEPVEVPDIEVPDIEVPDIEVRRSEPDELDAWVELVTDAGVHPDTQGLPMEEFPGDVLERAERDAAAVNGIRRYLALRHDQWAGGGSLRIFDGIAQMTGAATAPAHRRHGVQTALLAARLADAAAEDCDVAVVTTQPGSKSQHNVQRRGFDLLYTRAVLLKHP
jgi:ribosomal protein S18 acetylase RimI-like enzyme